MIRGCRLAPGEQATGDSDNRRSSGRGIASIDTDFVIPDRVIYSDATVICARSKGLDDAYPRKPSSRGFRPIDIDHRGQALLQDRQRGFKSRQHFSIDTAQSVVLVRERS